MRFTTVLGMAAVAGVAGSAMGQFEITPGGANAGNGWYEMGAPVTSATGAGPTANHEFRPGNSTSQDQMFQQWWWFRANNDTREHTFANTGTPFSQSFVPVGGLGGTSDTGGYDWTVNNTAGGYSFTAKFRYQIVAGTAGPIVNYSAEITNTTATGAALNLALFNYHDYDALATAGNDTWAYNGGTGQYEISEGAVNLFYKADNFAARQSTAFATLRGLLSNTAIDNLNNTDVGSPGDFTAGFQWNLSIPGGGSAIVTGSFGFIPAPGTLALAGLAGLAAFRRRR